jgi:hypothetical protein
MYKKKYVGSNSHAVNLNVTMNIIMTMTVTVAVTVTVTLLARRNRREIFSGCGNSLVV